MMVLGVRATKMKLLRPPFDAQTSKIEFVRIK